MKTFTKTEVSWLINLLEEESRRLDATMTADGATSMEQALAAHMWENYQSVKSRLAEALGKEADGIQDDAVIRDALLTVVNRITLEDEKSGEFEAGDNKRNMVTFKVDDTV